MSKTVLPEDFQNKLNIVCILADKFNVRINGLIFDYRLHVECYNEELTSAVIDISFSKNGAEGKFYKYKDSDVSTHFSFVKLFDNDSWYALILEDKITSYYFKDEAGVYQSMSNLNKVNITYSDDDNEINMVDTKKKEL